MSPSAAEEELRSGKTNIYNMILVSKISNIRSMGFANVIGLDALDVWTWSSFIYVPWTEQPHEVLR